MEQLIQILTERPIIIAVLFLWPAFLYFTKVISHKILFKYEKK